MTDSIPMLHHHYLAGQYGYGNDRCNYRDGYSLDTLILANQMSAGHQHLGDKIHTASVNGIQETSSAARDTVDAVRDSVNATNQIGNINLQATERNGGENRSAIERSAGETRSAVSSTANQNARDFAGVHQALCQSRQEMAAGFGAVQLEASKQHCDIKLEMCKQHAELARQIDARAAEAAKALAECCCETKELVRAENAATRQLLQTQALDDCRRREATLQGDLNLLKFAQMTDGKGK